MKISIFDLDGCISDDRRRRQFLPPYSDELTQINYEKYHQRLIDDPVLNHGCVRSAIRAGHHLVFITARPKTYEQPTLNWLHDKFNELESITFSLLMRPEGNHMNSPELKVMLFESQSEFAWSFAWSDVIEAYDDRDDVLMAYAERGVSVLYNATENGIARLTDTRRELPSAPSTFRVEPAAMEKLKAAARTLGQPFFTMDLKSEGSMTFGSTLLEEQPWLRPEFEAGGYTKDSPDGGHHAYLHEPEHVKDLTVPDILEQMARTFRERSKVYGPNYLMVGKVMEVMFPDGLPDPKMVHRPEWHLFELMIVKLTRLAVSELKHVDSVHDTAVYAAMIEYLLREEEASSA